MENLPIDKTPENQLPVESLPNVESTEKEDVTAMPEGVDADESVKVEQLREELQRLAEPAVVEEYEEERQDIMEITAVDRRCIGEKIGDWEVVEVFRCLKFDRYGDDLGESSLHRVVKNGNIFRSVSGNYEPRKIEDADLAVSFSEVIKALPFGFGVWRHSGKWHVYLPSWRPVEDTNGRQGAYTRPPVGNEYFHYFKTLKEKFGVRVIDLRHISDLPMVNIFSGKAIDNHRIAGAQAAGIMIEVFPVTIESY